MLNNLIKGVNYPSYLHVEDITKFLSNRDKRRCSQSVRNIQIYLEVYFKNIYIYHCLDERLSYNRC